MNIAENGQFGVGVRTFRCANLLRLPMGWQ
jgi:hypothetical protein